MLIGYARLSEHEAPSDLARQRAVLTAAGCSKIFVGDTMLSGRQEARQSAMAFAREGDVIMVARADRLARTPTLLLRLADGLSKRGVGLVVMSPMGGPWLDTRDTSSPVLTVLRSVVAWDRTVRAEFQRAGIKRAKEADPSKYRGGQPSVSTGAVRALAETMGPTAVAKVLGVARSTVYAHLPADHVAVRKPKRVRKQRIDARTVQVLSGLMRTGEIAKQLGISTSSVRRLRVPKPDTSPPGRWR